MGYTINFVHVYNQIKTMVGNQQCVFQVFVEYPVECVSGFESVCNILILANPLGLLNVSGDVVCHRALMIDTRQLLLS